MPSTALKPKHPGGRPTAYRPEFGAMIIEAMATGLSAEAAAAKIGISARSLFNWQKEHPEFLQSVQEGRHRARRSPHLPLKRYAEINSLNCAFCPPHIDAISQHFLGRMAIDK